MQFFGGLDWGSERHAVCVVDAAGHIVFDFEPTHDAEGLQNMIERLGKIAPPADLPIAIERPSGLVVDTLVNAGYPVVPVHPNVVKACRPRYRAAAGKHDRGDAYLLADVLRTDGHRFRQLTAQSEAIKALRAEVRVRGELLGERIAVANQLRALLESFWPGPAKLFSEIDSLISLAFIRRYPTPQSTARLGEKRLATFLRKHRYTGRRSAAELLGRLRAAAAPVCSDIEAKAKGELVKSLARVLAFLAEELAKLTARIEHDVEQLADGQLLMSFPRIGKLNVAQILAELGDVRERFQTEEQLAAEAGVSPVTRQSGKFRSVCFRWACNHRLRAAITTWADNSRHQSPWAADVYQGARRRGHNHAHAIRILARAWVRVLWRVWTSRTPYDPQKHRGATCFQLAA